jgi:hypothetical protein
MSEPSGVTPPRLFSVSSGVNTVTSYLNVSADALFCVELIPGGTKCSIDNCPYPAAQRNAQANQNGLRQSCIVHAMRWLPKPGTPRGDLLLG